MRSDFWPRVDHLLEQALELPEGRRSAFLEDACGGDEKLLSDLLALLEADHCAGSFLERPMAVLPPPASSREEVGDRVGPYRLIRVLGRGGMGTVYLGERDDDEYRRQVAVKVIRSDLHPSIEQDRFRLERQVLAELEHPSIARLYDGATTEDGRPYLVMELIDGLPIDVYCDRHRMSISERLALFRRVCEAVQYAHRNLVVHRDLKPANILVTSAGTPKLLDFGIAKLLDVERFGRLGMNAARTQAEHRPMSLQCASPEQILGKAITTATDVYALGVLLYLLLTGRSPYRLDNDLPHELERAILEQEPERPSAAVERTAAVAEPSPESIGRDRAASPRELRRRLRGDLDTIVLTALCKEPARRYGSAQELADDVARHLADRPVLARPDTLSYRLGKLVRRHALPVAAAVVVATLLFGFSVVTLVQSARLARERNIAQSERIKAQKVLAFFTEMFEEATPDKALGAKITVREVLDRSKETIDGLADQPDLQATFMHTIGTVYRSLGLYGDATQLLARALRLRRQIHGREHLAVAESLNELANTLEAAGDYETAERYSREALTLRRKLLGPTHADVAMSEVDLALLLYDKGDFDAAELMARDAIETLRQVDGGEDQHMLAAITNLALALQAQGYFESAEPLHREALALSRRLYGPVHPEVAISLNNLAGVLRDLGDLRSAESMWRESLAMRRQVYGPEHPAVARVLSHLGLVWCELGDVEKARPFYEESLAVWRKSLGEESPYVAIPLIGLARLRLAAGESVEAERLVRQALRVARQELPRGHWRIAYATSVLGAALTAQGRFEEAEPLLVDSYHALASQISEREGRTRFALEKVIEHYERREMAAKAAEFRRLVLPRPARPPEG